MGQRHWGRAAMGAVAAALLWVVVLVGPAPAEVYAGFTPTPTPSPTSTPTPIPTATPSPLPATPPSPLTPTPPVQPLLPVSGGMSPWLPMIPAVIVALVMLLSIPWRQKKEVRNHET